MLSKFGKGGATPSRKPGAAISLIAADVRIVGNVTAEGEIQIDGQLEGDLRCDRLLVGESGRVTGEITSETIRIHGEVIGRITASAVVVARAGRVTGDIVHDSLEIEAGATLEGRMIRKSSVAAPALAANGEPARLAPPRPEDKKVSGKGPAPAAAAEPA